jgi:hypothetical protein
LDADEEPKPPPPVLRRYFDEKLGAWVTVYATPSDTARRLNLALPTKRGRQNE